QQARVDFVYGVKRGVLLGVWPSRERWDPFAAPEPWGNGGQQHPQHQQHLHVVPDLRRVS
ncbi:hypothetical protein N9L68_08875, partial [bacterium]|nr:hypothetical protein [bacterium]